MAKFIDLTGMTFGKWTVVSRAPNDSHGYACWRCRCECGDEHIVIGLNMRRGKSVQCRSCSITKHGEYRGGKSVEARTWEDIIQRCTNPDDDWYPEYGGRGITVCERWRGPGGLANFVADMGRRPGKGYSIDRIDNERGYEPGNCRWATGSQQQRNRRCNQNIAAFGKSMCPRAWEEETGIHRGTIVSRLRAGWSAERAVSVPVTHGATDDSDSRQVSGYSA